ncbi:cysteine peptidase family C39 domain-containing protein [Burkholderia ambifaria]|uniref:cysteine peptidase family C39 domain-containing protein n=1 Tax=Burkholderia ambifaria TaxID=152480 RepID=UPI002FDFB485
MNIPLYKPCPVPHRSISSRRWTTPCALRLALHELGTLHRPCILHWNMNHFVAPKSVSRGKITIHDPACATYRLPK